MSSCAKALDDAFGWLLDMSGDWLTFAPLKGLGLGLCGSCRRGGCCNSRQAIWQQRPRLALGVTLDIAPAQGDEVWRQLVVRGAPALAVARIRGRRADALEKVEAEAEEYI